MSITDCEIHFDGPLGDDAQRRGERLVGGQGREELLARIAELKVDRDLAESHADDNLRLARMLREGLQRIYAERGEDPLIASICSPLIDASDVAA
jgi:hypothetical protein